MGTDKEPWLGEGCSPHPCPPQRPPQPPARSTHPRGSLAAVLSLWALCCGKNIHLVNSSSCLCRPCPGTVTTHLLSWEVPASPGKPPPPTLPGHLLLLQLVHGALWADEGHGIFPCTTQTHLRLSSGLPRAQSLGVTLKQGTVNNWMLRNHIHLQSPGFRELSTGDQGPLLSTPAPPQP